MASNDKGKGVQDSDPKKHSLSEEERFRIRDEVARLSLWYGQEGESLFHHRERLRAMVEHGNLLLEKLDKSCDLLVSFERAMKDLYALGNPSSSSSRAPNLDGNVPNPGSSGVALNLEEDPEEDPEEEPEEEPEELFSEEEEPLEEEGDVEIEAVSDGEEVEMWVEEPPAPEVIEISSDEEFDEGMEELWEAMEDDEPEVVDPEVVDSDNSSEDIDSVASMSDSDSDGSDSGDDPDFEVEGYNEGADFQDEVLL